MTSVRRAGRRRANITEGIIRRIGKEFARLSQSFTAKEIMSYRTVYIKCNNAANLRGMPSRYHEITCIRRRLQFPARAFRDAAANVSLSFIFSRSWLSAADA